MFALNTSSTPSSQGSLWNDVRTESISLQISNLDSSSSLSARSFDKWGSFGPFCIYYTVYSPHCDSIGQIITEQWAPKLCFYGTLHYSCTQTVFLLDITLQLHPNCVSIGLDTLDSTLKLHPNFISNGQFIKNFPKLCFFKHTLLLLHPNCPLLDSTLSLHLNRFAFLTVDWICSQTVFSQTVCYILHYSVFLLNSLLLLQPSFLPSDSLLCLL